MLVSVSSEADARVRIHKPSSFHNTSLNNQISRCAWCYAQTVSSFTPAGVGALVGRATGVRVGGGSRVLAWPETSRWSGCNGGARALRRRRTDHHGRPLRSQLLQLFMCVAW